MLLYWPKTAITTRAASENQLNRNLNLAGGAYVPTLFVGMYAPLGWLFLADSADMPKDGTSALPVSEGALISSKGNNRDHNPQRIRKAA